VRNETNPLLPLLRTVGLGGDELFRILDGATSKWESVRRANDLLDERRLPAFDEAAGAIANQLEVALGAARTEVAAALGPAPPPAGTEPSPTEVALNAIRSDFDHYDVYDSIIFPISYGYLGETGRVEVIRISPEDAPSIINELTDTRRKLAGTAVSHFGGFLDERWRRNDMMWGRLDAAERIVTSVLAGAPDALKQDLVKEAHLAIIADEFTEASRAEISNRLLAMALGTADGKPAPVTREERARLEATIADLQTPEEILAFMTSGYEVDRRLDLDVTLKTAGRAAVVTGAVLDGISTNPRVGVITKWIARVGRAMWGFAELASPKTPSRLLRYWAWILALAALLMVGFGIAFNSDPITHAGWLIILVLAGLTVTTWILRDVFARRARELAGQPRMRPPPPPEPRWKRWLRSPAIGSLAVLVTAVVGLAVVEIVLHLKDDILFWN
jgi:hypothetical protein